MAEILPFPDKPIRDWRDVVEFHKPILLTLGHSREAIEYAFARAKPVFDQLKQETLELGFPENCQAAVDALKDWADRQGVMLFHVVLGAFAERFDAIGENGPPSAA